MFANNWSSCYLSMFTLKFIRSNITEMELLWSENMCWQCAAQETTKISFKYSHCPSQTSPSHSVVPDALHHWCHHHCNTTHNQNKFYMSTTLYRFVYSTFECSSQLSLRVRPNDMNIKCRKDFQDPQNFAFVAKELVLPWNKFYENQWHRHEEFGCCVFKYLYPE